MESSAGLHVPNTLLIRYETELISMRGRVLQTTGIQIQNQIESILVIIDHIYIY